MGVFQNISIVRKRDEVLSTKQFAWTMGLVSLVAGIIVGVACVYIEMSNKYGADVEHSLENRWAFGAMAVLVLYCVYLILPFMKSAGKTVGEKILTAVVGCGLIGGGVYLGARLVMFAFLGIVILFILRIFGNTAISTLASAGKGVAAPPCDLQLMDGTKLYEDSFGGGYRDNYGHHYEKVDGKIVQKD